MTSGRLPGARAGYARRNFRQGHSSVITGYNTDVRHDDRVFHVQTEDKGAGNPYIESLIYVGGQVLDARRTTYDDLLESGAGESEIAQRMETQHQDMIAAIRAGNYDAKAAELFGDAPTQKTAAHKIAAADPGTGERTLDEVILDYLAAESKSERMVLQLDEEVEIVFGVTTPLQVRTCMSSSGEPIPGAEITIKMISTLTEPRILATGVTQADGTVEIPVQLPELAKGNSALIITAGSDRNRAELKYLL